MRLSIFDDLEHEYLTLGGHQYERFRSLRTGYESLWNAQTATDQLHGIPGHTGILISPGDPGQEKANAPALGATRRFVPPESMPWTPLQPGELTDREPWTHTTGPGNRRYTAPALRYALSTDPLKRQKGYDALRQFCRDQMNRPLSHVSPFDVRETYLKINPGTTDEWTCDTRTAAGWNAWDPAHLCMAIYFAAAILGIQEGLVAFFMHYRIQAKGFFAGTTFWCNQPRAVLWVMLGDMLGEYVGFTREVRDLFFHGVKPKDALRARIRQYCAGKIPFDPMVPNGRAMTQIPGGFRFNGVDYGSECDAEYNWQRGMRTTGFAMIATDPVIATSPERAIVEDYARRSIAVVKEFFDPLHGMAWEGNRTEMPLDACQELHRECDAIQPPGKSRHPYKEWPTAGGFKLGGVPLTMDCALHLLGWALLDGKADASVAALTDLCPPPGSRYYEPQTQDAAQAVLLS